MKTTTTALSLTLAGLLGAPALAGGGEAANARTTDRAPQQVAALLRGVAAGNGWAVQEEVTLRGGEVIALQLCQEAREDDRATLCGQFAVLGNGTGSEIVLLHVGAMRPAAAEAEVRSHAFSAVFDAASAPAVADDHLPCDSRGCP